jgi:hypothetical protein
MGSEAMSVHHLEGAYRMRDLATGVVVLIIGLSMVYLFRTSGDAGGLSLVVQVFGLCVGLVVSAWVGGAACECLGRHFPGLIRMRYSHVPHVILTVTLLGALALAYLRWRHAIEPWLASLWPGS